jgi:hypothetical protein
LLSLKHQIGFCLNRINTLRVFTKLYPKLTYTNKKNDSRIPYQRIFTRNIKKLQEISFNNFDKQILIYTFFQFLPLNKSYKSDQEIILNYSLKTIPNLSYFLSTSLKSLLEKALNLSIMISNYPRYLQCVFQPCNFTQEPSTLKILVSIVFPPSLLVSIIVFVDKYLSVWGPNLSSYI